MVQHFGRSTIREIESGAMIKPDDFDQIKSALYEEFKLKQEIGNLQNQLQLSQEKEKHQGDLNKMYKEQLELMKEKVEAVDKEANYFRKHHSELCKEYEGQDEAHYKQVHVSVLISLVCIVMPDG